MADLWTQIHDERRALIEDVEDLTAEQWTAPSLCGGWSVHDVLAHQLATAKMTPGSFVGRFISSGFSFGKFAQTEVVREAAGDPRVTLETFKRAYRRTTSPPGPKPTWLGEALIHSEDIRRPLGLERVYPMDAVVTCLDFFQGSNMLIGAKSRIAGLTVKATDVSWRTGSGPLVEGPALALLMVMTGRKAHLDQLVGDGVPTLRSR